MNQSTYIESTKFFNYEDERIQKILEDLDLHALSDVQRSQKIFLRVRDGWRYHPYHIFMQEEDWKASSICERDKAHCLDKAILLCTLLRGAGLPARIHLAKVKNHIAVEQIVQKFGHDELTPHGLVDLYLNGRWIKLTPAFNKQLCEKLNVAALEFDGENHAEFQEYDKAGGLFMEYLEDYGSFDKLPIPFIWKNFEAHYPELLKVDRSLRSFDISKL